MWNHSLWSLKGVLDPIKFTYSQYDPYYALLLVGAVAEGYMVSGGGLSLGQLARAVRVARAVRPAHIPSLQGLDLTRVCGLHFKVVGLGF